MTTPWPIRAGRDARSAAAIRAGVRKGILRHSPWDALLLGLALAHGALLWLGPPAWMIALGLWWNANTISHNFIHLPFFRTRLANVLFSAYLSLVLGIPQTLWRDRHLAHHAGMAWKFRGSNPLFVETLLVAVTWAGLAVWTPQFFLEAYLPGYAGGLILCWLQGRWEHAHGATSHYGKLYNLLFFNDGYHAEHHARPAVHWRRLPQCHGQAALGSSWPAVLRWLDWFSLEALERLVCRCRVLQSYLLRTHARAFGKLLGKLPTPRKVVIIGGGLFPRTALVLRRLAPQAELVIVEAKLENLICARRFLERFRPNNSRIEPLNRTAFGVHALAWGVAAEHPKGWTPNWRFLEREHLQRLDAHRGHEPTQTCEGAACPAAAVVPPAPILSGKSGPGWNPALPRSLESEVHFIHAFFNDDWAKNQLAEVDLLVLPLAFKGDREAIYLQPPVPHVLVHDWLWKRRGSGAVVSVPLLKRLNLVRACWP